MAYIEKPLIEEENISLATINRLNKILSEFDTYNMSYQSLVFLRLMKEYFKIVFFIRGEFTYEDLIEKIDKTNLDEQFKLNLKSFIKLLLHLGYSKEKIPKNKLKSLIGDAKGIVTQLHKEPTKRERDILLFEAKLSKTKKEHIKNLMDGKKKKIPNKLTIYISIVAFVLIFFLVLFIYYNEINKPVTFVNITDVKIYENTDKINIFDLDDFFISRRKLDYVAFKNKYVSTIIDKKNRVSIFPAKNWTGMDIVMFRAWDGRSFTYSNNVEIEVIKLGCGNGICESDETCSNCTVDCGICQERIDKYLEYETDFQGEPGESASGLFLGYIKNPYSPQLFEVSSVSGISIAPDAVTKGLGGKMVNGTSIPYNSIKINPIPCVISNKLINRTQPILFTKSELEGAVGLPVDYSILIPSFSMECDGEDIDVTLSVPDNYENISMLRCRKERCSPYFITEVEEIRCEDGYAEEIRQRNVYINSKYEDLDIKEIEKEINITPFGNFINISNHSFMFYGDFDKARVKIMKNNESVTLPKNPALTLLSTPIILKIDRNKDFSTSIVMPYHPSEGIEESSIAVYVNVNKTDWIYVESKIDEDKKTVTADIVNITKYVDDNTEVSVGLMGVLCSNCVNSTFERLYQPKTDSKEAVILVHGLVSSPLTYQELLDDIKLTEQPWQVWAYGYPSSRTATLNAIDLANKIEQNHTQYENIYIVGHSLGGLIIQEALYYSYKENIKAPKYNYLRKVRKVILAGAPNKGSPVTEIYKNVFKSLINIKSTYPLFNINSQIIDFLAEGRITSRVPGIDYNVIAGTKPYKFTNQFFKIYEGLYYTNDGIITTDSASLIGDDYVQDKGENYWEINATHTELIDKVEARKIIESIIAKNVIENVKDIPIMGKSRYFELPISNCSSIYNYVVIGKKIGT